MQVEILRGQNKIGGNIFVISQNATKILVEFGSELTSDVEITEFEKDIAKKEYDCAIISHYHGDHAANIALLTCPIYMGNACKNILETMSCHMKKTMPKNICIYQPDKSFSVGEITVTPFLCDHSAYDSYMFLFEASGEKIFYTGDFRSGGRKNFDKLLEKLPTKIDTLIYEGTNLTRNIDELTEKKLEEKAAEFFENNSGNIFILQASVNIDRLVSFYRAAKRSGRKIYVDDFQAQILLATSNKNIPNPNTFNDVYCFTARQISGKKYEEFSKIKNKITINQIKNNKTAIVFVRQSMLPLIKKLCNSESTLIYSMWQGYEEKPDMKSFLQEIQKNSIKILYLHASGHASVEAINKLKEKANAKQEIVVHTDIAN
ncbi:MBL fold metallo-hydrolase [Chryseobacterium sp.]|uniref:MBL fold metallo-hydrolase n=1 Tax=Chryseobacterium sp. TaxID=1871047 RepID=UPI002FCC1943